MSVSIHVFYGAQYMGDENTINDVKKVPDGAFILLGQKWYTMFHGSLSPINKADLPATVKAQLAILGVQP